MDEETYTTRQAIEKLTNNGLSSAMLFRGAKDGTIRKYVEEGQKRGKYSKNDVDVVCTNKANGIKPKKTKTITIQPATKQPPIIRPAELGDIPYIFTMECGLLPMKEVTNPHTIVSWLEVRDDAYWILANPKDPKDIWATMTSLPLSSNVTEKLLRGKITIADIKPDDIGGNVYFISTIVDPEKADLLNIFAKHVFAYWSEKHVTINRIYALSHGDASPIWQKDFFFSLNYDMSNKRLKYYVWEFRPDFPNPSEIQNLRKDKMQLLERPSRERLRKFHTLKTLGDKGSVGEKAVFRRAELNDIPAILAANKQMFGRDDPLEGDKLRAQLEERTKKVHSWMSHNTECVHVLEYDGKIVGYLTMLPLPMSTIERIMNGEIKAWQIDLDEILPYAPGQPANIYIQTLAVHPDYHNTPTIFRKYGSWLIRGIMDMIYHWGVDGFEVQKIFTRSDTEYGQYSSIGMGFVEEPAPLGVHKRIFVLDMEKSAQPFLLHYRQALQEYRQSHQTPVGNHG